MVCTRNHILIENNRPDLNAEGAIDIMGGGSGISLREGNATGTLTDLQADIFRTPRPRILLYNHVTDPMQTEDISEQRPDITGKLLEILGKWKTDTGDSTPEALTPDWYDRKSLKKNEKANTRGEMPGQSGQATRNNNSGPF